MDNMASEAERLLFATHYSGECKRFNFEHYVRIQKYQQHILEGLKEHGYVGIDTRYQIRHSIEGIKITQFDAAKAQIMAATSLITDYDECVSFYKTFIDQSNNFSPPELNISGVESYNHKGGGQKKRKCGIGGAVKDVYYYDE